MIGARLRRSVKSGGAVLGLLLAALMACSPASAQGAGAAFTVTSSADAGDRELADAACDVSTAPGIQCTLRAAIQEANDTPNVAGEPDSIGFGIGGAGGVKTIAVGDPPLNSTTGNGPLPAITDPVTIDGYTQGDTTPDASDDATENTLAQGNDAVLLVELDGTDAGVGADGLVISAPDSVVRGLVINRFRGAGVAITGPGATGVGVRGNFIGTDPAGAQDLGNSAGVEIGGPTNTIGGTDPADRNLISGNGAGIEIDSDSAIGNSVLGNYVGTDRDGAAALGNSQDGVQINPGTSETRVGGATGGAGNVISGNGGSGLAIYGSGNSVEGNLIGTNAAGTAALANDYGVFLDGNLGTAVGGTASGTGNVISGNRRAGVRIEDSTNEGGANRVEGNLIGTDKSGTRDLGNGEDGVAISSAPGTTVGGTTAGAANTIAFNAEDGVRVQSNGATGNRILRNSIFSNAGLGINLAGPGEHFDTNVPTANDPGDPDGGPNNLQNKPSITLTKTSRSATTIKGRLESTPGRTFIIRFFSNPPGAQDEGKMFVGQKSVGDANGDGIVSFTFQPPGKVRAGLFVTATAADTSTGDTSEFSAPKKVRAA